MNVLILGGTLFLGRHLVDALLVRGHAVTTFTRGTRPSPQMRGVTRVHGDRTIAEDLERIADRPWDAVIDTSTDTPAAVTLSAARLQSARRYAYVSSISVYDIRMLGLTEDTPPRAADADDPDAGLAFGARKAACEEIVRERFDARALIVRPGLIVGPYDPTNRFTYWVDRFRDGGDVLVPGPPERTVQFIDARDLAKFIVGLLERDAEGTLNVTSPRGAISCGDLVAACAADGAADARPVWPDEAFLVAQGLEGWMDLPLWVPGDEARGIMEVDVSRALAAGLRLRPLGETVAATRAWLEEEPPAAPPLAGITRERERELLERWHVATSS